MFTQDQIEELIKIVNYHSTFLIGYNLGSDALSNDDKNVLKSFGIDIEKISDAFPPYLEAFMWGRLSAFLSTHQASTVTYTDFKKHLESGQFIPLSPREKKEYEYARQKTYNHIKSLNNKVVAFVSDTILTENQEISIPYSKLLEEELSTAIQDRKSIQSIISNLGNKTEDWQLDWARIVDTEMNSIFQNGRLQAIIDRSGVEAKVYKDVFEGACKYCIKLLLTEGIGSKPIVFDAKTLIANGSNIGRKQVDWKATIPSLHPMCRCTLRELLPGHKWDEEEGTFKISKDFERKVKRKSKIKIEVGDKTFYV